jgi:type II secretory pathway component GspD/PulD (secretin)
MDNVELTVAIQNLARMAKLNYILDPKLNFGGVGPDGKPVPQPSVSVRWENVTAQQALHALLTTYGLQIVEDPKTQIARITAQDPAAAPPVFTRIFQLKYAGPSNLVAAVQATLNDKDKRSKVIADVRSSQIVVVATEKELEAVDTLLERLDTPTRQVLIEAKLLETSMNPSTSKGMDWAGTLAAQNLAFGNNLQKKPVTSEDSLFEPLATKWPKLMFDTAKGFNPGTAFLDADGVNVVLSYLNQYSDSKVISAPTTVTLDNEMAHIEVGQNYPILTISPGSANTPGGASIAFSNLTVRLDVTPRISANNLINLKVSPHIMRLDHVGKFQAGGEGTFFDIPIFDTRALDTTVLIPSGNTLVMGGLMQDDQRSQNSKVPFLGDAPVLGRLFRSDSKARQKNNLLVFVTPTIVGDEDFQPTKTGFLQTRVPTKEDPEWSAKDSGKPYDWSKADK